MGKCVHILHYKVVLFRYAISIWKTQLKDQQDFSAPYLLLKQPMWDLSDQTISFFVSTCVLRKNRKLLLEFHFNRHGILQSIHLMQRLWPWQMRSLLPSKYNTLFWPSIKTFWSPITYAESFKCDLSIVNQSNQRKNVIFVPPCKEFSLD